MYGMLLSDNEHILISRSEAECIFHINNAHFYPENVLKVSNCEFIPDIQVFMQKIYGNFHKYSSW